MTSLWQIPAAVLTLLIAFTEGPGTLGTLARREALRRQMTGQSKATLNNLSLPEPPPPAVSSDVMPPVAGVAGEEGPPAAAAAGQKPDEKKDESYWRDRMTKARQALAKDEAALPAAQGKANSLTTDAINMDDPARQGKLRQQLLTQLAEVERLKAQIEADKKAIADIQAEARRANVPPGWIR